MASTTSSIYGDEATGAATGQEGNEVMADVLDQASAGGFSSSSDKLGRRARAPTGDFKSCSGDLCMRARARGSPASTSTTGSYNFNFGELAIALLTFVSWRCSFMAAMVVDGNKLQAFELRKFAAKGKLVKVKASSMLSDAAKKAATKDTAKPKKTAAVDKPNKVAAAGPAVAWCIVIGLIVFSSFHRNPTVPHQQAGVGRSSAGDGAAGSGGGISSSYFPSATKLLGSMVGPTYQSLGPTGATCTACKSSAPHATTLRLLHAGVRLERGVWWRLCVREPSSTPESAPQLHGLHCSRCFPFSVRACLFFLFLSNLQPLSSRLLLQLDRILLRRLLQLDRYFLGACSTTWRLPGFRFELHLSLTTTSTSFGCRHDSPTTTPPALFSSSLCVVSPSGCTHP